MAQVGALEETGGYRLSSSPPGRKWGFALLRSWAALWGVGQKDKLSLFCFVLSHWIICFHIGPSLSLQLEDHRMCSTCSSVHQLPKKGPSTQLHVQAHRQSHPSSHGPDIAVDSPLPQVWPSGLCIPLPTPSTDPHQDGKLRLRLLYSSRGLCGSSHDCPPTLKHKKRSLLAFSKFTFNWYVSAQRCMF